MRSVLRWGSKMGEYARWPFVTYLNAFHNSVHFIFAKRFLAALDALPSENPMTDRRVFARLEIVLERNEGRVIKKGVVRTSGITAFDIAAKPNP